MEKKNELTINTGSLADHYLMMVGKLVNHASICDANLFEAFKIISGCEQDIASAIYFSAEAFSMKKAIVKRVAKLLKKKNEQAIVQELIDCTEKAQNQRNELSHSAIAGYPNGALVKINRRHQDQPQKPVSGEMLADLLKKSSEATIRSIKLLHNLRETRGIPQPKTF